MKTVNLKVNESTARELYKNGSGELKTILEESLGKNFFYQNITEQVKSYEDACEILGIKPIDVALLLSLGLTKNDIAYIKLTTIIKAINEGWMPDMFDNNVKRWYPYFYINGSASAFRFLGADFVLTFARAGSGSRLCVKNEKLATYVGKEFIELWKEFIL